VKKITTLTLEEVGGAIAAVGLNSKLSGVEIVAELPKGVKMDAADAAAHLAFGAQLRSYRFDKYRTKQKPEDKPQLKAVTVICTAADKAKKAYFPLAGVAESIAVARDLVTEPPNMLYPVSYAAEIKKLEKLGIKVEVLGEAAMKKLGMGSLLGVGQGSERESQLVVMQWHGGKKGAKPVALIGKGVTFDTGGISIKPANGMEDMKYDMGGSATVVGTMRALAARGAKVNAVGVVGLVENMPDGNAQRPSDVVTSMSGQTIEVLNTDAEGRLVLADALWYTQDRFKPQCMLDLATLTGAIVVALGSSRAGMFSNNDAMCEAIMKSAERTGEKVWRLPLAQEYDDQPGPIRDRVVQQEVDWRGFISKAVTLAIQEGHFASTVDPLQFAFEFVALCHGFQQATTLLHDRNARTFALRAFDRLIAEARSKKKARA
jgi:leucyl aminopeptidase